MFADAMKQEPIQYRILSSDCIFIILFLM